MNRTKAQFVVSRNRLTIEVKADEQRRSIIRRLTVRTLRDVPLDISVDAGDPTAFEAHVVKKSSWGGEQVPLNQNASVRMGVEKEVVVEIKTQKLNIGKATLILSSPLLNGARTLVPVQIGFK